LATMPHPVADDEGTRKLVIWGWITTLLIAPVGAILAIVLLTRNKVGHGVAMLVVCAVWVFVGWQLIDSASQGAETGDIEAAITSDLGAQLGGDGAVEDVTCARDSDTHATCYAEISGDAGGNYSIDVRIDQNTGEYVWQVE
jgi:hypothetical protein